MGEGKRLTWAQRRRLPKAKLFWMRRWQSPGHRFMKFRNANAMFVVIRGLEIGWRMPWIPSVARRLHPEVFSTIEQEI